MVELKYHIYRSRLIYEVCNIDVGEQPAYFRREFTQNPAYYNKFMNSYQSTLGCYSEDRNSLIVLESFKDMFDKQLRNCRQYGVLFSVVPYDELGYLELANISRYSKYANYLIDLSDRLDLILAYISGGNFRDIQKGICEVCRKYGISERIFSRAWTTCEPALLKMVHLEMLYEISPDIEMACRAIIKSRNVYGTQVQFRGINLLQLSDFEFLQMAITSQILIDMQYILACVLLSYKKRKEEIMPGCMVVSKGLTHLLFSAYSADNDVFFDVELDNIGIVTLQAIPYLKYQYPSVLLQDKSQFFKINGEVI